MITRRGVGLLIAAVVLIFVGGSTKIGWVMLVDGAIWGGLILSAIMPWLFSGRLDIRRFPVRWESDPGPSDGEEVEFEYRVKNTGRFPALFVSFPYNYGPEIQTHKDRLLLAWLRSGRSTSVASKMVFQRRGFHTLPQLVGDVSLPFGLFRRRPRAAKDVEVLVYPRVYSMEPRNMLGMTGHIESRPTSARTGDQVIGSRIFTSGDAVRHIHWRNFARTNTPQVKEFEETSDDVLTLYFEPSNLGEDALEDAIRITASVGAAVCRMGQRVRVLAGSVDGEYTQAEELLKDLALLTPLGGVRFEALKVRLGPHSQVLAIVSSDDDGSQRGVETLVADGHQAITVALVSGKEGGAARVETSDDARTIVANVGDVRAVLAALEGVSDSKVAVQV